MLLRVLAKINDAHMDDGHHFIEMFCAIDDSFSGALTVDSVFPCISVEVMMY